MTCCFVEETRGIATPFSQKEKTPSYPTGTFWGVALGINSHLQRGKKETFLSLPRGLGRLVTTWWRLVGGGKEDIYVRIRAFPNGILFITFTNGHQSHLLLASTDTISKLRLPPGRQKAHKYLYLFMLHAPFSPTQP